MNPLAEIGSLVEITKIREGQKLYPVGAVGRVIDTRGHLYLIDFSDESLSNVNKWVAMGVAAWGSALEDAHLIDKAWIADATIGNCFKIITYPTLLTLDKKGEWF